MEAARCTDLDLMLHRDRNNDTWVQAVVRPGRRREPVQIRLPDNGFRDRLNRFANGTASGADIAELGNELFDTLFPAGLRTLWEWAVRTLGREQPLRLRLDIRDPELTALPWELICPSGLGSNPLALSPLRPVVRYTELLPEPGKPEFPRPLRILIAVAEPSDRPAFDAAGIVRRVEEALGHLSPQIVLHVVDHLTRSRLDEEMGKGWDVVQFIGHGGHQDGTDCLFLEEETGGSSALDGWELGRILLRNPKLRLFVSCACGGRDEGDCEPRRLIGVAEAAFRAEVPAVVAMQSVITDREVADFSYAFYDALADGERLEAAMTSARHRLSVGVAHGISWAAPVLYSNIYDGLLYTGVPAAKSGERAQEERPGAPSLPDRLVWPALLPWPTGTRPPRRNGELRAVEEALGRGERLILVQGPAGYGSSSLIMEAARRYLARPDNEVSGVAWAYRRTSPLSAPFPNRQHMGWTAEELFRQIAAGLRIRGLLQATPSEQWHLMRGALAQRRYLLLIDDIDELRALTAADLLDRFPAPTTILATSHVGSGYGEASGCVIPLAALPLGDAYALVRDTAAELGLARAQVPGPEELEEVLGSAAGDTLALRLFTGALADGASTEEFAVPENRNGVGLIRHVIRHSMGRLTRAERTVLQFAAVFPEPLEVGQMAEVVRRDLEYTQRCVHRLEVLGLVTVESGTGRIHVSQRVRVESLFGCGQAKAEQLITEAVAYGLVLAERHVTWGHTQHAVLAGTLRNEFWAASQAYGLKDWPTVLRFRAALEGVLVQRHWYNEALQLGEWGYDAADRVDDDLAQAWCALYPLARVHLEQGSLEEARRRCELAYDKFARLDHRHGRALAERYLARVFERMGFPNEAELHWLHGLELASQDTPPDVRGHLLAGRASAAETRRDTETAQRLYEEALELYRASGEDWGVANMEYRLGRLGLSGTDRQAAKGRLQKSLDMYETLELSEKQAEVLRGLAELAESEGDLPWAHTNLLKAARCLQEVSTAPGLADVEAELARVTARQEAGVPLSARLSGTQVLCKVLVRCPDCDPDLEPTAVLHHYEPHFPVCAVHKKRYVETVPVGRTP